MCFDLFWFCHWKNNIILWFFLPGYCLLPVSVWSNLVLAISSVLLKNKVQNDSPACLPAFCSAVHFSSIQTKSALSLLQPIQLLTSWLELSPHACFSSSQLQVTKWPYENTRIKISHELPFICVLCSWSKMSGQILLFICFPFMVESDELQLCSPEMVAVWWRVWKLCSDPCRETQIGKIMVTDQQNWVLFFPLLGLLVGSWVSQIIVHLHN